jgi:hypothetical protein
MKYFMIKSLVAAGVILIGVSIERLFLSEVDNNWITGLFVFVVLLIAGYLTKRVDLMEKKGSKE